MKKGFTLIELLAVIIILAIISLIATPIILEVIDNSRKSAGLSESNIILNSLNNYCEQEKLKGSNNCNIEKLNKNKISEIINLGNADVLEYDYNNKITWLKVKSNGNIYSLKDNKMVLGDYYRLIDKLLEQLNKNKGLEKENENVYYFKGNKNIVNQNFLWYGGHHWRILEFDTKKRELLLMTHQPLTSIQFSKKEHIDTVTKFLNSYGNKWINEQFYNSLSKNLKNLIIKNNFIINLFGKEFTINQKIGILSEKEYLKYGGENSYIDIKDPWWISTTKKGQVPTISIVDSFGKLNSTPHNNSNGLRPVIKIREVLLKEGDGTLEYNYSDVNNKKNLNDLDVGEYINIPINNIQFCGKDRICTFRIIEKNNDKLKIILNGFLNKQESLGELSKLNQNSPMYKYLDEFAKSFSSNTLVNGDFFIGNYYSWYAAQGTDYNAVKNEQFKIKEGDKLVNPKIALPTIGEIFSGNDIDIDNSYNKKEFIDEITVENSRIAGTEVLLNRLDNKRVWILGCSNMGYIDNKPSRYYGVRPVLYININSEIVSGQGTSRNPYLLK